MANNKGRPPGSKNLRTVEEEQFREKFRAYCYNGGFDKFVDELQSLKGAAYVKYFLSAVEFDAPRLARTDSTINMKVEEVYTDEQANEIIKLNNQE